MSQDDFTIHVPKNPALRGFVDAFFYIDIPVETLVLKEELVMPFPRISFGYFFDHPFVATNHDRGEACEVAFSFSRITGDRITVRPQTQRVKIVGCHLRAHALALLGFKNVSNLPWTVAASRILQGEATRLKSKLSTCDSPDKMFAYIGDTFLKFSAPKGMDVTVAALKWIEKQGGNVGVGEIAEKLKLTSRTLRNHFSKHIGCSPKQYIHLTKLKQSVYAMRHSRDSLTAISHEVNYSDQAHFTNTMKNITGASPKQIRKDILDFRFLQF